MEACAGRKWCWRYQRHLRPAHDRWSPQTRSLMIIDPTLPGPL